jgi:hypothetical protein
MGSIGTEKLLTHMIKYTYAVLMQSNLMASVCLYLDNSQLLYCEENNPIAKNALLTLKEESIFLGGEKLFEKS